MPFNENQNESQGSNLWNSPQALAEAFSSCMVNVYLRMFTALLVTTLSAFAVVHSPFLASVIFSNSIVSEQLKVLEIKTSNKKTQKRTYNGAGKRKNKVQTAIESSKGSSA